MTADGGTRAAASAKTNQSQRYEPAVDVRQLNVHFGTAHVLKDVSFEVGPGESYGIVGESGQRQVDDPAHPLLSQSALVGRDRRARPPTYSPTEA